MDYYNLISLQQAQQCIEENGLLQLSVEKIDFSKARHRVLAEDVYSPEDLPPFSRSTMDGYAVNAADTFAASEENPVYLKQSGEVLMGERAESFPGKGKAVKIATGAMLPAGADAVVKVEYTSELDHDQIEVFHPVRPGEALVEAGEDIAAGEPLLRRGALLGPAELGALAALGVVEVPIFRRPRVGIISTGDELISPAGSPAPGEIRDINSYSLSAAIEEVGGRPILDQPIGDSFTLLKEAVMEAVAGVDLLLISGGSSVGTRDVTVPLLEEIASDFYFHGVAVKPGKPTIFAIVNGVPVFGLPGHPVSVLVIFSLLVKPLLLASMCRSREPALEAKMVREYSSDIQREQFLPLRLEESKGELLAHPLFGKSSLITTLVEAGGLVRIPMDSEGLRKGQRVQVIQL